MQNRVIMFQSPMEVQCIRQSIDKTLAPGKLLVKKHFSLISTGTELKCLMGLEESWFPLPSVSGYCCVSEVIASGRGCAYQNGTFLFHYGTHSDYQIIDNMEFAVEITDTTSLQYIPMLRMASVAFTAIRNSDIELGDYVLVAGLGLVGNMASQLAMLSGGFVIGSDPSAMRREKAAACGVPHLLDGNNVKTQVDRLTEGKGVHTAIEAVGIPKLLFSLLPTVGYHGEMILLGAPYGDEKMDVADFLANIFNDNYNSVTIKGAHEWRYPLHADKHVKHSIERNTKICLKLISENKLLVEPLITHILKPDQAPQAYLEVHENRDAYLGIIIDWT